MTTAINIEQPVDIIDTIKCKIDELYQETKSDDRIVARQNINELAELLSQLTVLTDSAEAKIIIIKNKAYDQNDGKFDFSSDLNQKIQDIQKELFPVLLDDLENRVGIIHNLKYFLRFLLSEFNFNEEDIELEIFDNYQISCYIDIDSNDTFLYRAFTFLLKEGLSWPACKISAFYRQTELNKPTINIDKKVFTVDQLQNFINDCLNSKNETPN